MRRPDIDHKALDLAPQQQQQTSGRLLEPQELERLMDKDTHLAQKSTAAQFQKMAHEKKLRRIRGED